jgi:glutathione S-transferase
MRIYELPHSPYCIPITHALTCFGVPFERVEVPGWDRRELALLTGGRYYQVPVLEEDGEVVFETAEDPLAVARYIDRAHCGGALFPAAWSGIHELVIAHIEGELEGFSFKLCDLRYLDTIADLGERTMVLRHKERAFGRGCLDTWRAQEAALRAGLERLLEGFDRRLRQASFLFGDDPVYADFALFGVIGNYTYRDFNQLPPRLEALVRWHGRMTSYRARGGA